MTMQLQNEINTLVHKHLAKEVEYSAAMARQLGFKMPTNYALGFSAETGPVDMAQRDWWMVLRLRLDDFSQDFKVRLAGFSNEDVDLAGDLTRCSVTLVAMYIDANPGIKPNKESSQEILKMLSDTGEEEIHRRAAATSDNATYTEGK